MRSIWKGSLSFGLVNVPVKLYSATEDHDVSLHQVHEKDGGRIHYERRCEVCNEIVQFRDIDKAYDEGGTRVMITDDDLKTLPAERDREIEVVEFVPSEQVDPLMFDRSYYLEPDGNSPKSYVLLRKTLEATDRMAIARFAMRQKTHLAALRVRDNVLVLQTLLWSDEVRDADFQKLSTSVKISDKELALSEQLVESYSGDFKPEEFVDEYQKQLRELIARKAESGDVQTLSDDDDADDGDTGGEVIDLMEALRQSVDRSRSAKKAGSASAGKGSASASEAGSRSDSGSTSDSDSESDSESAGKEPAKKTRAKSASRATSSSSSAAKSSGTGAKKASSTPSAKGATAKSRAKSTAGSASSKKSTAESSESKRSTKAAASKAS